MNRPKFEHVCSESGGCHFLGHFFEMDWYVHPYERPDEIKGMEGRILDFLIARRSGVPHDYLSFHPFHDRPPLSWEQSFATALWLKYMEESQCMKPIAVYSEGGWGVDWGSAPTRSEI